MNGLLEDWVGFDFLESTLKNVIEMAGLPF